VAEVLVVTAAISALIREGKTHQIPSAIATGKRMGMQLMDQALLALVRSGDIDPDEALLRATDPRELSSFISAAGMNRWTAASGGPVRAAKETA